MNLEAVEMRRFLNWANRFDNIWVWEDEEKASQLIAEGTVSPP